ncbi:MAG: hypothetical protein PWQ79_695 [Thermococcaceae archaeon]|nr:hypothetical protein [Thermococcaceae archaeon]MDK2913780.1 hypothetical protein [Thermococcaceae archaeon]
MERIKSILSKRLEVVKLRKYAIIREEARLMRLAKQKKQVALQLAKVKREKLAVMAEEARLLRAIKQAG